MDFENVDVISLKNAINACRNSINYNSSVELINCISNNDVWCAGARDNLKKALETLTNCRYKDLEKKLDSFLGVANMIEEYKSLKQKNVDMQNQIQSLNSKLYSTESTIVNSTDSQGNATTETKTIKVKNHSVQNKIDNLNREISNNKQELDSLKNKITASM